jgi:hypothetical protein
MRSAARAWSLFTLLAGSSGFSAPPRLVVTRRQCAGAAVALWGALCIPEALAAPSGDTTAQRLRSGLATLDDMIAKWAELTLDCNYGEINRALLETDNKQQLLAEASGTSKASTTVTMCKSTAGRIRPGLGVTGEGALARVDALLSKPATLQRVDPDALEAYQEASEALQRALSAADAAAFYSSNDFSARTTFKRGDAPSTPSLDKALDLVQDARAALAEVCKLVGAV